MILPELVEHSAERLGECKVLIHEEKPYTNLQFFDLGKRLHQGLDNIDVKKGDVIIMCLINHPLIHPIFQGIFRTGAVAVPVMFALTADEIRFILTDSKATGIITDPMSIDRVREAAEGLDHMKWIGVLGGEEDLSRSIPEYKIETMMENEPKEILPFINEHDLAMMLYTAGTTGKPKGVMLTHKNLYFSAQATLEATELAKWEKPPVAVNALPLAHIFGVGVMNLNLMMPIHLKGAYTVVMTWFEPEQFMQLVEQHKANRVGMVPTMIALLLNHPKVNEYDLTSLKDITSGSAPLPIEQAKQFCELVKTSRIRDMYGCTESTGVASAANLSIPHPPGSVGKAYPGTDLAIFDENDNPVAPNQKGEIVLKGQSVMKGYFNRPEATAETLRHGWLHTGDIGHLDEEGFLYISDRKKDMIIRGGENIYPCELEEVMYQYPAIAEAAVVGEPDDVYGETVVGYVVLKKGHTATSAEIIEFMKSKITKFKVPSVIHFIDALPKSLVGKILKRELRDK